VLFVTQNEIKSAPHPPSAPSPALRGKEMESADFHDVRLNATPENPYANLPGGIA
jgi:hypothetical protein